MMEKITALEAARHDVARRQMRVVRLKDLLAFANAMGANAQNVERKLSLAEIQLAERTAQLEAVKTDTRH